LAHGRCPASHDVDRCLVSRGFYEVILGTGNQRVQPGPAGPGRRVAPDVSGSPLAWLLSLEGRVAVVTGGANGIGLAICARVAESGAQVVVADVDGVRAAEAAARLGGGAAAAVVDVADADAVRAVAQRVLGEHGRLDVW